MKFLCGDWGMDPYTIDGDESTYLKVTEDGKNLEPNELLADMKPREGDETEYWVWKTNGKCGWPEKVNEGADDNSGGGGGGASRSRAKVASLTEEACSRGAEDRDKKYMNLGEVTVPEGNLLGAY